MSKLKEVEKERLYEYRGIRLLRSPERNGARDGRIKEIIDAAITYNKSEEQSQKDLKKYREKNPDTLNTPESIFIGQESFSVEGFSFEEVSRKACSIIDQFYIKNPHLLKEGVQ